MIGRVWKKLNLPAHSAVTAVTFVAWSVVSSTTLWGESATYPPPGLIALAAGCQLVILCVVVYLRKTVRERLNVPGDLTSDAIITIPWTCCLPCQGPALELASMDRALGGGPMPSVPSSEPPTSKWSTSLLGCDWSLTGDLPQYQCGTLCPFFIHVRLLYRLGLGSCCVTVGLIALQVLPPLLVLLVALAKGSFAMAQLAWSMWLANPAMFCLTVGLRWRIRSRYSIFGTLSDDVLVALCCSPCLLAQMERETMREVTGKMARLILSGQDKEVGGSDNATGGPGDSISIALPESSITGAHKEGEPAVL
jgi:Cys-rich protein (TIGR01571 family)